MMPARVRIKSSGSTDLAAFVQIAGEQDETRVRWRPGSWRCDMHGTSELARCAHARAVVNADAYAHHFHNTKEKL